MRKLLFLLLLCLSCYPGTVIEIPYFISFNLNDDDHLFSRVIFAHETGPNSHYSTGLFYDENDSLRVILVTGISTELEPTLRDLQEAYTGMVDATINPQPTQGQVFFATYWQTGYYLENDGSEEIGVRFSNQVQTSPDCFDTDVTFEIKSNDGEGGKTNFNNGLGKIQICKNTQ